MLTGGWVLNLKEMLKFEILSDSLPDHSCKPRTQTKQRMATFICHNNKLTSEMYLLGFRQVWGLCALVVPFISLLYAAKPYQCANFSNRHFP